MFLFFLSRVIVFDGMGENATDELDGSKREEVLDIHIVLNTGPVNYVS